MGKGSNRHIKTCSMVPKPGEWKLKQWVGSISHLQLHQNGNIWKIPIPGVGRQTAMLRLMNNSITSWSNCQIPPSRCWVVLGCSDIKSNAHYQSPSPLSLVVCMQGVSYWAVWMMRHGGEARSLRERLRHAILTATTRNMIHLPE